MRSSPLRSGGKTADQAVNQLVGTGLSPLVDFGDVDGAPLVNGTVGCLDGGHRTQVCGSANRRLCK